MKATDLELVIIHFWHDFYRRTSVAEARAFLEPRYSANPPSVALIEKARQWWTWDLSQAMRERLHREYCFQLVA